MTHRLFIGTSNDKPYLTYLKPALSRAQHQGSTFVLDDSLISTWAQIAEYCSKRDISTIISTSGTLLGILLRLDYLHKASSKKQASISSYAGSIFKKAGIEILFINPLDSYVKVPYGKFLNDRYLSKVATPGDWPTVPAFSFTVLTASNLDSFYEKATSHSCILIAIDIETLKEPLSIRCISYSLLLIDSSNSLCGFDIVSGVLAIDSPFAVAWMRKLNGQTTAPKVMQNGKYDCSYLALYAAPLYYYLWDTATMMHCWLSELPKDLASLNSFFVRDSMYWKDLADTTDLYTYYEYNARDTMATMLVFLAWIDEAPQFARANYLLEFPLLFACHLSEMTGIKRDTQKLLEVRTEIEVRIVKKTALLEVITATPGFNPNSHVQVKQLLVALGCRDIAEESSDEKSLARAAYRHPLNKRILDVILDIRGDRKLVSTYLDPAKDFKHRVLYSLNPHGTDTGRLASREHHYWTGLNIQNQPRGKSVKQTYVADDGFAFGECDLEQAESRDTAYITGDITLIKNVSAGQDFHSLNASAFFGTPYQEIYDDATKKVLLKDLRDLSKRVNHGANYNMGPSVLVDTMGLEKIYKARSILGLPRFWEAKQIAEYLLGVFGKTYPTVREEYPAWIKKEVAMTRMLVGATGWTRYCFSDPSKNKQALNAYIAHCPQSLNGMVLNKAYMKVFYDLAMSEEHRSNFKLLAQIHDSILFQYRIGHEYLGEMVKERMEIPVRISDIKGVVREFTVPAALKMGTVDRPALHWSECE